MRNWGRLQGLASDIRLARRRYRRDPAGTAVALAMLLLGLAGCIVAFAAVYTVLLQPLPYAEPSRLVRVFESRKASGAKRFGVSPGNFVDWRSRATAFGGMAIFRDTERLLSVAPDPEYVRGATVSPDILDVLGIRPVLGSGFRSGGIERTDEVILAESLWRRVFGADPAILGRRVVFDHTDARTVVGVMPPGFAFPEKAEFWLPLEVFGARIGIRQRGERYRQAVARLRPGVSLERAQAEMDVIAGQLAAAFPTVNAGWSVVLVPMRDVLVERSRPGLLVAAGAVASCLLLVCVNLAALLLVRGHQRERELATRYALGASRWLLARQVLVEGMLLTSVAGIAAVVLANWTLAGLVAALPADSGLLSTAVVGPPAVAAAIGLILVTGLIIALGPAAVAVRASSRQGFERARAIVAGRRLSAHHALVAAQVGLALALLVTAGLFVRSYAGIVATDLGFEGDSAISAEVRVSVVALQEPRPWHRLAVIQSGLLDRLRLLPGVLAAGATTDLPLTNEPVTAYVGVGERTGVTPPSASAEGSIPAARHSVSPEYFSTLGIVLTRGRLFSKVDAFSHEELTTPGAKPTGAVAVVSESLARRLWANEDPIEKLVRLDFDLCNCARTVVGVVRDVHYAGADKPSLPEIYLPYGQAPTGSYTVIARFATSQELGSARLRQEIRAFHPAIAVREVTTVDSVVRRSYRRSHFLALTLTALSSLALAVATCGVYSLVALLVGRRTKEFGLCLALGARHGLVVRSAIGEAIWPTAVGVGVGLALVWIAGRAVSAMLVTVQPADPVALGAGVALTLVASVGAAVVPARRTMKLDPAALLRSE